MGKMGYLSNEGIIKNQFKGRARTRGGPRGVTKNSPSGTIPGKSDCMSRYSNQMSIYNT